MSLLRGARQTAAIARPSVAQPASFRQATTIQQRAYAADGKTQNGAEPKILKDSPPDEKSASQEVREHNKDFEKRVDRPAEKVKDEDVEKDKVPRGYWGGSEYTCV